MATVKAIHYFDSFGGLIPCRELYRGEQITVSKFRVILRSQVYIKDGQYWIHTDPSHV